MPPPSKTKRRMGLSLKKQLTPCTAATRRTGTPLQKHTATHSGAHNLVLSGYCHISLQMLEANLDEPGDMLQSMSSSTDNPLKVFEGDNAMQAEAALDLPHTHDDLHGTGTMSRHGKFDCFILFL